MYSKLQNNITEHYIPSSKPQIKAQSWQTSYQWPTGGAHLQAILHPASSSSPPFIQYLT